MEAITLQADPRAARQKFMTLALLAIPAVCALVVFLTNFNDIGPLGFIVFAFFAIVSGFVYTGDRRRTHPVTATHINALQKYADSRGLKFADHEAANIIRAAADYFHEYQKNRPGTTTPITTYTPVTHFDGAEVYMQQHDGLWLFVKKEKRQAVSYF